MWPTGICEKKVNKLDVNSSFCVMDCGLATLIFHHAPTKRTLSAFQAHDTLAPPRVYVTK